MSALRGIDLHSHVIPGVDDGARDLDESRTALEALRGEGIVVVVATPHVDGSLTQHPDLLADRLDEIDEGWSELTRGCGDLGVALHRGVELKLDVPEVDLSDPRLRLGGSRAVLVEFPFMTVPPRSAPVLSAIRQGGYVPVLAHPERYVGLDAELSVARSWLDAGAVFQVNLGSLLGRYGPDARRHSLELLAEGWVSCLASDFHSRGAPRIIEARNFLQAWGHGAELAVLLAENPGRLLADEPCLPVEPITVPGRMTRAIRRLFPW